MKNILILALLTLTPTSFSSNLEKECGTVAIKNHKFISFFKMDKSIKKWEWNKPANEDPSLSPEYAWITEPGRISENGLFIPGKYAFASSIRNFNSHKEPSTGNLQDLYSTAKLNTSIYLNTSNNSLRNEANEKLKHWQHSLKMGEIEDGYIFFSEERKIFDLIFSNNPTHARLTTITPYLDGAHRCITEIIYE